jgi:hypothetical protein
MQTSLQLPLRRIRKPQVDVPLIPKTPLGGLSLARLARGGAAFAGRFVFIDLARPFCFLVSAF